MNDNNYIIIAAAGCSNEDKKRANFVCEGKNDELIIQKAIELCFEKNKNLLLLNGRYSIDAFYDYGDNGPKSALCIPNAFRELHFFGQNNEYGMQRSIDNGVVLYVSKEALQSIDGDTDVLRGRFTETGMQNGSSLRLENLAIVLANNQHPIRCIDLRRTDRVEVKNVSLISYGDSINKDSDYGLGTPPSIPAKGCIGLTMTDGSNYNFDCYTNVQTWGFDEGIQVGGEHVIMINCGAAIGNYGFTFGNYKVNYGANHPILMLKCFDERNINLPLFNVCGDCDRQGNRMQGNQGVNMVSFSIERVPKQTPGGKVGDLMREVYPGSWAGNIDFTAQPDWHHNNDETFKLWENDGSGSRIKTRNLTHKTVCSLEERLSYYPTLGQEIFDTTLNKKVICIDPENKKWVDFNGNKV